MPAHSLELMSPVNTWLLYSIPIVLAIAALIWKRTPLEWISPRLDYLFIAFFRAKPLNCATCAQPANLACHGCGEPVCPKHLQAGKGWRSLCPRCKHPA